MLNIWMILAAGMGTVFVALLGLIIILYVFKIIFGNKPMKKRAAPMPLPEISAPLGAAPSARSTQAAQAGDSLVAAIVAAISATSGLPSSGFKIASISPSGGDQGPHGSDSGFNTPVWGRVERFVRK